MPKITVGRDEEDKEKYGLKGTGMIGKHLVGENQEAHAANPIYFDLARPHVVGLFGKRGTGKCLLPDELVYTEEGLEEVKELFDRAKNNAELSEIEEDGEELYRFEGPETVSIDEGFGSSKKDIVAAYRKKVDEKLLKIETRSGRSITVTKEHPLRTVKEWENAGEISEGQKIAVPRNFSLPAKDQSLDIPEEFEEAKYSSLNRRESEVLDSGGGQITELEDGTGSFRGMVDDAESKNIVKVDGGQVQVTEKGRKQLQNRKTDEHYRLGKAKPIKVSEIDTELAEFMSFMIAEGHEQKINEENYRVIFTNNNQEFLSRFEELGEKLFDIEFRQMDSNSIYTNCKALEKLLEENGYNAGSDSFGKNIPNFIISGSKEIKSRFLQIYYDCEGNVTDQQIELSTASKQIANAINYMLLEYSIIGRTTQKEKFATNTEEKKVRTYQQITISGSKQLKKFKKNIDFSIERKSQALEKIIKEDNTNVDTVPCSNLIKECREVMGASRPQIAKHKQSLKAYEDGKYQPSRNKINEIAESLQNHLEDVKATKNKLESDPTIENIKELVEISNVLWRELKEEMGYKPNGKKPTDYKKYQKNPSDLAKPLMSVFERKHNLEDAEEKLTKIQNLANSDVYWDEVTSIEKVDYEGWVYDLTVKDDHNFTAGTGGILCHNSYSMGTLAEEIQTSDVADNCSTIIIDSMGIYWSMKHPNDRAASLLDDWGQKPETFDPQIYIPEGKVDSFEQQEMPYDETFTVNPGQLTSAEWAMALSIDINSETGILLDRIISELSDRFGVDYTLDHIIKGTEKFDFDEHISKNLENRLRNAEDWGIFGEESSLGKFTERGELSIIDTSVFGEMGSGWSIRSLIVGLLAKRILRERMEARRVEELDEMEGISKNEMPIVWMMIDEAHQFLPAEGETPATHPLLRWVKIGREPGVSLVLATQQPAKLHPNALSQCDIVLSHRLTAKQDIDALGEIMQTYMRHDIQHYIDALPDRTGTGLIMDDNSERIFPVQMRPRKSWHAGGTPDAFEE